METPDYQYELLEEVAKAGWRAGWLAFMDAASMELHKRGWKIAIPVKAVA